MLRHLGFVLKAREGFETGSDMIRFTKKREGTAVWPDTSRKIKLDDSCCHLGRRRCGHGEVKVGRERGQRMKG